MASIPASSAPHGGPQAGLRAGALGWWHVLAIGLARQSLALPIYFNAGFIEQTTGPIVPVVFGLVMVGAIPTAVSFAVMNKRHPSAGGAFTWLWEAVAPPAGAWLGWVQTTQYTLACVLQPIMFGLFCNALLASVGAPATFATAVAGGLVVVALVAAATYGQVQVSARVVGVFMVIEAAFVTALAVVIIVAQARRGDLSTAPLDPAAATGGVHGVIAAAVFGMLAISGFDVVAPIAEETRTPSRLLPWATILIVVLPGLYWIFTSYGIASAVPVNTFVHHYMGSGQVTPVYLVAGRYIGDLKVLVPLTGMTAVLACFGANALAAGRMLYAVAREGLAPGALAKTDPRSRTPWNAQLLVLAVAAVAPIGLGIWQGSYLAAFGWTGQVIVFFILIPHLAVNLANPIYHLRYRHERFHWLTNAAVPALGLAIDGYVLYTAFFQNLPGKPFKSGGSIIWLSLAWAILGMIWTARAWTRRPAASEQQARG
jgi:amino acid transporter